MSRAPPHLERLRVEGQHRATIAAKKRVLGAVHLQREAGVDAFTASANAIAAETGRPLEEVVPWLRAQVKKFQAAKAKLEAQFAQTEVKS